jgi:SSS family solute:Na+ symporter
MDFLGGQGPLAILSFFILGAWTLVDPGFHQRVASCKDAATGQRGVFWAIGCWFVFDVLTITAGLYGLDLLKPQPASGLQLFPALGNQVLPPGLKGLFLCGLIGTLLSAFVGYLLVSGGTFGREIVARLQPKASAGLWSRIGIGVGLCVAIPLALSVESVVALWYSWAGAVVGALLIPVAIAYLAKNRRIGAPWVAASMILSFAVAFGWLIAGLRTNNPFLEVSMMGQKFGLGTLVPGVVVSAAVLGIGALASKKELEQ